jgi:hypothetical protein
MKEYYSQHVKDYKRRMRMSGEVINKIADHEYSEIEKAAFAIVNRLNPTHFVTLQLKQQRQIKAHNGWSVWVRGDDTIYCNTYRSFIRALSKKLTPRAKWEQHKQMLANVGVIEGGSHGKRNHLHLVLTKPDDISEEKFRRAIYKLTYSNSWMMDGKHRADVQQIESAKEKINATFYSSKKGIARMLIA